MKPEGGTPPGRDARIAFGLTVAAIAIGLLHAWTLRWTSDDAFITFRYIDQWLAGHGLVYNPGERVEGYTHPLWLCMIAGLRLLGADPVRASWALGLLSYLGLLALLGRRYPVTALVLAVHGEMAIWATGGLETSLFTFEVALLVWIVARWERAGWLRPLLAGLLSVAVVLTRPDGALFVLVAFVLVVLWAAPLRVRRGRLGAAALFLVPFVVVLVPYFFWKLSYYGDLLPNTYYAKSGGGSWWSQGFYYVWTFLRGHPTTALCLLPVLGLAAAARRTEDAESRTLVAAVSFTWVYLLLFVARVGGDFMYARFLVPVLPLLFLSVESFARMRFGRQDAVPVPAGRVSATPVPTESVPAAPDAVGPLPAGRPAGVLPRPGWALLLWLLPVLVLAETPLVRNPLFLDATTKDGRRRLRGIEDERWYWNHDIGGGESLLQRYERYGGEFQRLFEGIDVTVSILGQASLGYYGRFPRVVEENGLTEPSIARQAVGKRGRPGHEKRATEEQLADLGVDLRLLLAPPVEEPYRIVYFECGEFTLRGELLRYDPEFLERLVGRHPDRVRAVAFPDYFDYWAVREAPTLSRAQLETAAAGFERYYFRHNGDPARKARLRDLLVAGG